jgi:hypothetical protein
VEGCGACDFVFDFGVCFGLWVDEVKDEGKYESAVRREREEEDCIGRYRVILIVLLR